MSWLAPLLPLCLLAAAPAELDDPEPVDLNGCGVERWSVKTGSDLDAPGVDPRPVEVSIETLVGLPAPASLPADRRVPPHELTTFRILDTVLWKFKLEPDSDVHLVLSDGTRTMVVETASPACVDPASPFAAAIAAVRAVLEARFSPRTTWQVVNAPVAVTGVGFFDFLHGQTGGAPNGFELHPVLELCFDPARLPGDLGNTLRAARDAGDVVLEWGGDADSATYALYRSVARGLWPVLPEQAGLAAPGARLADVSAAEALLFYRAAGVSCAGREGP